MLPFFHFVSEAASKYEICPRTLAALCLTESNFNPWAVRFEPKWRYFSGLRRNAKKNNTTISTMRTLYQMSFGLCQIMGGRYYDEGGQGLPTELFDPEVNLEYAAKIVSKIFERHHYPWEVYAIYNAGSLRYDENHKLLNEKNVNRFRKAYNHPKIKDFFSPLL